MSTTPTNVHRPVFPAKAVVTAGMPYGNKELHFGHIGGVFIHADILARFLRDRIGAENVVFVSGTDCYGSAIEADFEKAVEQGFTGTVTDFVSEKHELQKKTLSDYLISCDLFGASALGEAGKIHEALSAEVFERLYASGSLKIDETIQFFDEEKQVFLNGRQVTGYCPIQGCKSEIAHADECSLGHQYNPSQLLNPKSKLSGQTPVRVPVKNWFFDLPAYADFLESLTDAWESETVYRKNLIQTIREFLKKPSIYVKKDLLEDISGYEDMPDYTVVVEEQKPSAALYFADLDERDRAVSAFDKRGMRYRTGKTIVPFRISGNISWGIPIPEKDGVKDLTFWVWPESLWAPVSFTKTVLGDGIDGTRWEKWWKSDDARVYQFIGEDNIYFYAIAEMGLFRAVSEDLRFPVVIPNHHLLFGKNKASSSGAIKPPMAADLLQYYTTDQLRLHFMNAGLSERSVGFEPKVIMGKEGSFDAVLQEGTLVNNVLNRLIRSCFYTTQKYHDGFYPGGTPSPEVIERANQTILDFEKLMADCTLFKVFELLNLYFRDASKDWAAKSKTEDVNQITQVLIDTFHVVRVATLLFHAITPLSCEGIRDYLCVDDRIWDWNYAFEPLSFYLLPEHKFKFLEPRVDFFPKHERQV